MKQKLKDFFGLFNPFSYTLNENTKIPDARTQPEAYRDHINKSIEHRRRHGSARGPYSFDNVWGGGYGKALTPQERIRYQVPSTPLKEYTEAVEKFNKLPKSDQMIPYFMENHKVDGQGIHTGTMSPAAMYMHTYVPSKEFTYALKGAQDSYSDAQYWRSHYSPDYYQSVPTDPTRIIIDPKAVKANAGEYPYFKGPHRSPFGNHVYAVDTPYWKGLRDAVSDPERVTSELADAYNEPLPKILNHEISHGAYPRRKLTVKAATDKLSKDTDDGFSTSWYGPDLDVSYPNPRAKYGGTEVPEVNTGLHQMKGWIRRKYGFEPSSWDGLVKFLALNGYIERNPYQPYNAFAFTDKFKNDPFVGPFSTTLEGAFTNMGHAEDVRDRARESVEHSRTSGSKSRLRQAIDALDRLRNTLNYKWRMSKNNRNRNFMSGSRIG